jgi:hypothetical protein
VPHEDGGLVEVVVGEYLRQERRNRLHVKVPVVRHLDRVATLEKPVAEPW